MPMSEDVYCVAVTFKMTEQVEQRIIIKFCIKLEHSSSETISMIQKAIAMGTWWLAASSQQCTCSCITSGAVFWQIIKSPRWPRPSTSRFNALQFPAFLKSKITFWREEISDSPWDSGKYNGAVDDNWETCVRSQGACFKRTEASSSYVQCFLCLVSSAINVSIFLITRLDNFWTDLVFLRRNELELPTSIFIFPLT